MNEFQGLNMSEEELDRRLQSPHGLFVKQALRALPEDTPSMAWRSELNQHLMKGMEAKRKQRRLAWIVSPALGLGLAGAMAAMLLTQTPTAPQLMETSALEESLVASHQEALRYTDVTGVGLNPDEVMSKRSTAMDLSEVDLGSL